MPRPKRSKVAPSKPITFAAIAAEKRKADVGASSASEPALSSRGTNGSDDSDGIVTISKIGVNRREVASRVATMSGALAVEDTGEGKLKPLSSKRRVALSRIAREADHAKAIEALTARRDAALAAEGLAKEGEHAEDQVQSAQTAKSPIVIVPAPIVPFNAPLSKIQDSQPIQVARKRVTPSRETSILDIENFKRRPRQPSLLQIAQAQKAGQDSELDDTLDDFNPDDESTPLHQSSIDPQREISSISSGHQSSSRKRKLSTPEVQIPASQTQSSPTRHPSLSPSLPENLFDLVADDSQPELPLPAIPTTKPTSRQPAIDSDTLAPPRSSSPPNSPKKQTRQQPKPRSNRPQRLPEAKMKATNGNVKTRKPLAPVLPPRSPSATQSSPTTVTTTRSPLKPITTSALQNLLPRRRRVQSTNKENNVFELNTSSDVEPFDAGELDEDADELSYHATTRASRKPGTERSKQGRKGKANSNGMGAKTKSKKMKKRPSMTYTRKQNIEADENEEASSGTEGEDVAAVKMGGRARDEMKKLAAKFREVDDWGLEFEEVTGSSDRMRDAR